MHPWHDSYVDDAIVGTAFPVVIEIPKGSKNKSRAGPGNRPAEARSCALQRGALPRRLRVHPANLLRRRRPARCTGHESGAGVSADTGGGARDRRDADARREGHRRQDRRGERARSGVCRATPTRRSSPPTCCWSCAGSSWTTRPSSTSRSLSRTCWAGEDAVTIIREALELYRKLRRGEILKT